MNSLNELFFNRAAAEGLSYDEILEDVQKYCTANHADTLSGETDTERAKALLKEFILQYLIKCSYRVDGLSTDELCENLYEDMAGFSFLKKWIYKKRRRRSQYQCLQRHRGHHERRPLHEDPGPVSVAAARH